MIAVDLINHISFWCAVEHLTEGKSIKIESDTFSDSMLESDIHLLNEILFYQKYYN